MLLVLGILKPTDVVFFCTNYTKEGLMKALKQFIIDKKQTFGV